MEYRSTGVVLICSTPIPSDGGERAMMDTHPEFSTVTLELPNRCQKWRANYRGCIHNYSKNG